MRLSAERSLFRWLQAGLISSEQADRIVAWESGQPSEKRLHWAVWVAAGLGGLALCAGIFLFISARWDLMTPGPRLTVVLAILFLLHAVGAGSASRFKTISLTLHGVGTLAMGAAIQLTGEIFHLGDDPKGILLWAIGAAVGWILLRQWPQLVMTALLIPIWLGLEYFNWTAARELSPSPHPAMLWLLCLLVYLIAGRRMRALWWVGVVFVIPVTLILAVNRGPAPRPFPELGLRILLWVLATGLPLALAWWLERRHFERMLGAAAWVLLLALLAENHLVWLVYAWCALGSAAMTIWGLAEEAIDRINLGVAGFAATVIVFFTNTVLDNMGRALGLIALGIVLLGGGWILERIRRSLVLRVKEGSGA